MKKIICLSLLALLVSCSKNHSLSQSPKKSATTPDITSDAVNSPENNQLFTAGLRSVFKEALGIFSPLILSSTGLEPFIAGVWGTFKLPPLAPFWGITLGGNLVSKADLRLSS